MKFEPHKFLLIALTFFGMVFGGVNTFAQSTLDASHFVYVFTARYDSGKLENLGEEGEPYDMLDMSLEPIRYFPASQLRFSGKVIGIGGKELKSISFSAQDKNLIDGGKILTFVVPFFANAREVRFFSSAAEPLLVVSVVGTSFCNDDGVCNADVGEGWNNCRNDCIQPATTLPSASPNMTPVPAEQKADYSAFIFLGAFVAIGIIAGYVIFRTRHDSAPPT